MDGKTKRLNKVLEDMLRACVIDLSGCWDDHLPLWSFPTITVIKRPFRWPRLRFCVGVGVEHRYCVRVSAGY